MSLLDTLQDTKNRLSALLAFANQKTGAEDSNIGDAIKTLCDGFGDGGFSSGTFDLGANIQIRDAAVPVFSINIGVGKQAFVAVSAVPPSNTTTVPNIVTAFGNTLWNGYYGTQTKTEIVPLGDTTASYTHYDPSSGELTFTAEQWRTVAGGLWVWAAM